MDSSFQKNPVDFKECSAINNDQDLDTVKQEFPKKLLVGKLICFFCNEEFESIDLLHSHQNNCSSVCDIQTVLANARSSDSMKRHFLSQMNLISTVKAKHLQSAKRQNVVVDVIVIDDNSDDENMSIVENQCMHYLQNPSNFHSKSQKICSEKSSGGGSSGQTRAGKFSRLTLKVFKFDLTSPLGMRLRYHDCCPGSSRLSSCRIINDYEQYCGYERFKTLKTSEALSWNRHFPVTFRKNRHLKYTHRYKFTMRHLRRFHQSKRSGLSTKSQKLRQQMKMCSIKLDKFDLLRTQQPKKFIDIAEFLPLLPSDALVCEKAVDEVVLSCDKACERKSNASEHPTVNAALNLTVKRMHRPHAAVGCEASSVVNRTLASMDTCCLNDGCDPPVSSKTSSAVYHPVRVTSHLLQKTQNNGRGFSFGNVEFLPLDALSCDQTADETGCRSSQLFHISSLFSMADSVAREHVNVEERACTVENVHFFANNLPPAAQLQTLVNSQLEIVPKTVTKSFDLSSEPAFQNYQTPGMITKRAADASAVIDLTEPPLQSVSETDSWISFRGKRPPATAMRAICSNARGDDMVTAESSAEQCKMPDSQVTVQAVATPFVIEIPDEDYTVTSTTCQSVVVQPSIGKNLTKSFERTLAMRRNGADHLPANLLPSHSASDQRPIYSKEGNAFQSHDIVDLSADSDCELTTGNDSLGRSQKRLNTDDAHLPPLTFKCHVCHCLFEFGINSSVLIKEHYSTHGIMNIEVVRHRSGNGRPAWSIVELGNSLTLNFPSYPMDSKQRKDDSRGIDATPSLASSYFHSLADSSIGKSVNCDVSSVKRSVEQCQQLSAARPQSSGLQMDKNCAGYQGVPGNNSWSHLGERTRASLHSHLSTAAVAFGDGMMSRNACRGGRELASQVLGDEMRSRRQRPISVQNSLTAFHIFPRPDFLEQHLTSSTDRENCFVTQSQMPAEVNSSSRLSNAKSLTGADVCSGVHGLRRRRRENPAKDCYSFVASSNCTQTTDICLD